MYINEIPMTREEKVKMYKKLTKAEIIEVLIDNIDLLSIVVSPPTYIQPNCPPAPFDPVVPSYPPYEVYCGDQHTANPNPQIHTHTTKEQ